MTRTGIRTRSKRGDPAKKIVPIFVQTYTDAAFQAASTEQTSIKSLRGKYIGEIEVLKPGTNTPAGCAVYAVSAEAAVYLKIVGKVDLGKEKEKAEASLSEGKGKVEKNYGCRRLQEGRAGDQREGSEESEGCGE
jgi:valyl-tRNA synthetase